VLVDEASAICSEREHSGSFVVTQPFDLWKLFRPDGQFAYHAIHTAVPFGAVQLPANLRREVAQLRSVGPGRPDWQWPVYVNSIQGRRAQLHRFHHSSNIETTP
jgi:hypothetical protein